MVEIPAEFLSFHVAELVVASLSLITNSALLYVILFKTPKELLEYRPFVFMVTFADLLFDIYGIFLVRPVMIFPVFAAIITGPMQVFGSDVMHYLAMLGVFMLLYCMFCINLAFFYRYTCIGQKSFHHIYIQKRTQILLHVVLIGIAMAAMIYPVTQKEQHELLVCLVEQLIPSFKDHVDEFVIVAIKSYNIWIFVNTIVNILPSCILNAVLAYMIVRKLRSFRSSFTAATYGMHLKLVACLLCQTFCPVILLAFPIMIAIYLALTDLNSKYLRLVSSAFIFTIACHPLLNALCTLCFVEPYRRVLIKANWIRALKKKFFGKNNATNHHSTALASVTMEMNGRRI